MIQEFEKLILSATPKGFRVASEAPDTWAKVQASFARNGKITVWSGESSNTVYSAPRVNWAFRAWHDSIHLAHGLDFSLRGEERTAERQCAALWKLTRDRVLRKFGEALLEIEIVDQARIAVYTGKFIDNQREFVVNKLEQRGLKLCER